MSYAEQPDAKPAEQKPRRYFLTIRDCSTVWHLCHQHDAGSKFPLQWRTLPLFKEQINALAVTFESAEAAAAFARIIRMDDYKIREVGE